MLNAFQSRLIHVSLGTATASSRSSYTPSTRGCDVSRRQNVVCCQQVTIINGAATLACPRSVIQPKRLVDPATTAPLTGRLESVHDPKLPPIPLAFVCQHPAKFAEARVCDRPRQLAVTHHSAHVEIFDSDQIESAHKTGRNFVEVILSSVCNSRVQSSHPQPLPLEPVAALDPSGQDFPARRNCRNDLCRGLRGWIASPVLSTASVLSPRSIPT